MSAAMRDHSKQTPSKSSALWLVTASYLMALSIGWLILAYAPIAEPISRMLLADVVATAVIFGWSVWYDNSSFYDAYWSVIPPAIVGYWILSADPGLQTLRVAGVVIVICIWGIRLTWNWARGWDGLGHEDWRYVGFRQSFPRVYWLISFTGIHLFPTLIVFLSLVAVYPALTPDSRPIGLIDALALIVGLAGIALEWVADDQLRSFTTGSKKSGETLRTGLWRYSRHPNYLGEIMIWWSMYLFGLAASPEWAKWALVAPLAMTGMFVFVTIPMLERRSLERRSNYQKVVDETSMLIPLPPRNQHR